MAAAEQPGHHRLRDAGGEAGGDCRVGGGAAFGEDLGAGLGGRGMPRGDHETRSASRPPKRARPGPREVAALADELADRDLEGALVDREHDQLLAVALDDAGRRFPRGSVTT